jgi:hypothetical protein
MGANAQMNAAQINQVARQAIKARSVRMLQQIFSQQFVPGNTPTFTVNPRNVGMINGFWIKVAFTVNNGSAVQIDLTDLGPSNVLSQIQFNDLNNNTRIQTPGWHLGFINSIRGRRPFGTSLVRGTGFDDSVNYGSNWANENNSAPATIPANQSLSGTFWYYVPLAYNPQQADFRGAVYANVVNATMQLNLSFAGSQGISVAAANGTDATLAMYQGNAAGSVAAVTLSSATVTVYQDYYDQLPMGPNGVLLPIIDLATIYELKQTTQTAIVAGQDFPYQYANFRDFLSTITGYVNNGSTGARGVGLDINYWALQSANFTNIWKIEPALAALMTRQMLSVDMPPGFYYFESREKPISTTQYGNMQLILNAITASNNPYQLVAVEDFALVQTLSMAGSLAAS